MRRQSPEPPLWLPDMSPLSCMVVVVVEWSAVGAVLVVVPSWDIAAVEPPPPALCVAA